MSDKNGLAENNQDKDGLAEDNHYKGGPTEDRLDRKRLSRALYHLPRQTLLDLAAGIQAHYPVRLTRDPIKILIMTNVHERLRMTKFHLGEALASEAMVEMNGYRGCAVFLGDDLEKTLAAAVVDCARNAGIAEWDGIEETLRRGEREHQRAMAAEAALIGRSKVDFNKMDRGEADAEKA
ncbi:MAG: phosphonate C-P lyase system protein PhnG [Peptococcaceae bacterium]|jgi:alpha-D-ribose 1-methylphosphonate 5-triphosphate synthase subunit PhnG|nr:phosphonate C-P lyase system protein PhnG [Peptococcaceae bacterium]